jgi:ABC-type dipeptide/oligopeptide/nickel transport system permease subunit
MIPETPATERMLALTLKIGAYSAFACIVAGLVAHYFAGWGDKVTTAGFLILLATPGLRIIVAGIQFLRGREFKYVLISLGVLAVIVLAYVLGIQA